MIRRRPDTRRLDAICRAIDSERLDHARAVAHWQAWLRIPVGWRKPWGSIPSRDLRSAWDHDHLGGFAQ